MKLAFHRGSNSGNGALFDWAIRLRTHSPYSHVELVFDGPVPALPECLDIICAHGTSILGQPGARGEICFSSTPADGGVRFRWIDVSTEEWDLIQVPAPSRLSEREAAVATCAYACTMLGQKYDWLGILGFVLPFNEHDARDKFCSEACAAALESAGIIPTMESWKISPGELYDLVAKPAPGELLKAA